MRGRNQLPPRSFVLPSAVAWFANILGIVYVIITTILFLFPPALPVSGSNMSMYLHRPVQPPAYASPDYCVIAFVIILIISTVQWFLDGRKNFTGPRTDMGLEVLEAVKSQQSTHAGIDPKLVLETQKTGTV